MQDRIVQNYIGGQWVNAQGGKLQPILNPATGETLGQVWLSTAADVDRAAQAAHKAFQEWRRTPPPVRARALFRLHHLMEENLEELTRIVTLENGKTLDEARNEVRRGLESVEQGAGIPTQMMGYNLEDISRGIDESAVRQPLGVCASINPFNFPSMVPMWSLPVALACGNTYIVKPSPLTPLSSALIIDLLSKCGLPDGVVNLINGDEEVVNALLDHPLVRAISFVGSTRVGKLVYERGARNGKRVQSQGGAKNHMVIMPDAKMDDSIRVLSESAFGCAGQRCLAGSVVITIGDSHQQIVDHLVEVSSKIKTGDGLNADTTMGPVITQQSLNRVCTYLERGLSDGAKLVLDGRQTQVADHPHGNFVGPSIFDGAKPGMGIVDDEIFGPVLSVVNVPDFESAIETVELSRYGNAASIFTTNGGYARDFMYRVNAGNIGVNIGVAAPVAWFPFGGMKDSFFGDLHGQGADAINFFTDRKIVIERWF